MKSSEKIQKHYELDLEGDLLFSAEDAAYMEKPVARDNHDLKAYLDFLEQIKAFETGREERRFYDAVFEL